ncbi:MAG: MFS transporter [Alphaproteobacteria bacterium]|nr:MFS transporter [Alphaproteobacteria bacterium]
MFRIVSIWWGLLAGILSLQLGNGLQSTLIGLGAVRSGFESAEISLVMSAFYAGYTIGPVLAPALIHRAGHIRVFAALAAAAAAAIPFFPLAAEPWSWALLRFVIGFSLSGMYVAVEAWVNDKTENAERGRVFALYILSQLAGLCLGQFFVPLADPSSPLLFAIAAALVSASVIPLALSKAPEASREAPEPMSLFALYRASPLGFMGSFVAGVLWAAVMGGGPVFAARLGLSPSETAYFMAAGVAGGIVLQFPLGWVSDHADRRVVLTVTVIAAAIAAGWGATQTDTGLFNLAVSIAAFGGLTFPIYSIAVSHTNDHLAPAKRVPASGGLVLIFGIGSIAGPVSVTMMMDAMGPPGFFVLLAIACAALSLFAVLRMAMRPQPASIS